MDNKPGVWVAIHHDGCERSVEDSLDARGPFASREEAKTAAEEWCHENHGATDGFEWIGAPTGPTEVFADIDDMTDIYRIDRLYTCKPGDPDTHWSE